MIEMNESSTKYNKSMLCINRYMNDKNISVSTQVSFIN